MKTQALPFADPGASDEECMRELARKRPEALQPLFARYAPLVFHIASQSLDSGSTEDIVQGIWKSGDIAAGRSFSMAFSAAGTYPYHCEMHPSMQGTVIVKASM